MMRRVAFWILRRQLGDDPAPSHGTGELWLAVVVLAALRLSVLIVDQLDFVFVVLWCWLQF